MSMLLGVCFSLLVVTQNIYGALGLTNREFFRLVEDYVTDLEIDGTSTKEADDDVIVLPGGPDEEIDLLYLFDRLGFSISEVYPGMTYDEESAEPVLGGCGCSQLTCSCCGSHRFKVWGKSFTLSGCAEVKYLVHNKGFNVKLTINGHTLYNKETSIRNPPPICYGVPGVKVAKVCLQFYNVDLGAKKACAKIVGEINLWVKKFRVDLKLGCFKIPLADREDRLRMRIIEVFEREGRQNDIDLTRDDDESFSDKEKMLFL